VSNTRPADRIWPPTSFHVAPDGLKDIRSPFLQEMYETYPVLLFWRLQIKSIYVTILEFFLMYNISKHKKTIITCKESYLTICWGVVYTFIYFCYNRPFKKQPWKWVWHPCNRTCCVWASKPFFIFRNVPTRDAEKSIWQKTHGWPLKDEDSPDGGSWLAICFSLIQQSPRSSSLSTILHFLHEIPNKQWAN